MKKKILAFFLMLSLVLGSSVGAFAQSEVSEETKKELLRYILFSASESSKEDVNTTNLLLDSLMKIAGDDDEKFNEVLRSLTESIDEYGEYYSNEEVNALETDLTGVSGGIGATVEMSNGQLGIVNVLPSSPAEKAGVKAGWKIINVDGEPMEGKSLYGALAYVRGEIGTEVVIDFLTTDKETVTLTLIRDKIDVASLSYTVLENTKNPIGYIKIDNFAQTTGTELKTALEEFKEKKIERVMLDLRYNGGGVLEGALEVASCFLPKGKKIVSIEPKDVSKKEEYASSGSIYDGKLILLVNEYTASASEVVTGALMDNKRAETVGFKTYGKGTVQTVQALPLYGGLFKFTTAHYMTPSGENINKKGINPTYTVYLEEYQLHPSEVEKPVLERKFDVGDKGDDVKLIKGFLTQLDYRISDDDVYDELTKEVVAMFQKSKGLCSYGICDFTTQNAIRDALLEKTFYNDKQFDKALELIDK